MEDRTANTIDTDRVPAFPEPSVPHHQGAPFNIQTGPTHDLRVMGQRTRGTRRRLGRLW